MFVEPITLQGNHVRLEPLSLAHLDGLCDVGLEPKLWRWTTSSVSGPLASILTHRVIYSGANSRRESGVAGSRFARRERRPTLI
jgi:hypothetical protein